MIATERVQRKYSMSMPRFPVSVILERKSLQHRFADEQWQACAVECGNPGEEGRTLVGGDEISTRWRFDGFALELHASESEGYFLNITAPEPKVFVLWRIDDDADEPRARPQWVTASYNEAARWLDGGEQVDGVAMAAAILVWLRDFVDRHYKPEPHQKSVRNEQYEVERRRRRDAR